MGSNQSIYGYGVYVYENAYFRYEGKWKNGKKHGHGKLLMRDGTFYEGQFVDGEIQGHGYKYFAQTGNKFTGQFNRGELHGYGIMQYSDGTMYEGEWCRNKKQGYGVMKTDENCTYEGHFHGHQRHGEGTQTFKNGDRYNGNWVMDKRQGHGDLRCMDGTNFEGQWANDLFHGQGIMQHASGIIYEGMWINGFPARMSAKIVIVVEEQPLEIQQGQTFSLRVECRNEEDELIEDQGRELQLTAGFKFHSTKEGSALFDMIEDVEDKPVSTPFGYNILSYPLTDQLPEEEEKDDIEGGGSKTSNIDQESSPKLDVEKDESDHEHEEEIDDKQDKGDTQKDELQPDKVDDGKTSALSMTQSTADTATVQTGTEEKTVTFQSSHVDVRPLPPPVSLQRTDTGVCEWFNLQLAPPPPMYRPFLAMEEDAAVKKSKSKFGKDKSGDKMDGKHSRKDLRDKSDGADEKYARPGEYVLMVQDVSRPTFFGRSLQPGFVLLKLRKPKRIPQKKEPKAKWDTARHIAQSMQRFSSYPEI